MSEWKWGERERERGKKSARENTGEKEWWRGRLGWWLGWREGENARVAPLVKEK